MDRRINDERYEASRTPRVRYGQSIKTACPDVVAFNAGLSAATALRFPPVGTADKWGKPHTWFPEVTGSAGPGSPKPLQADPPSETCF